MSSNNTDPLLDQSEDFLLKKPTQHAGLSRRRPVYSGLVVPDMNSQSKVSQGLSAVSDARWWEQSHSSQSHTRCLGACRRATLSVVCPALCLDECEFHRCSNGKGREDHFEEAEGARIDITSNDRAVT